MENNLSSFCFSDAQKKDGLYIKYRQTIEKVRHLIKQVNRCDSLLFIDIIQRLALDHHFSEEVGAILHQHYADFLCKTYISSDHDLYTVSLSFRLLRQAGFPITQDVFRCFVHENGKKFNGSVGEDTKGLLALFEASHLGFEGEDILEKAEKFSTSILHANQVGMLDDGQQQMVKYTLRNPNHKSIARLVAKNFIENNACEDLWTLLFQDLARMEFSVLGLLFQEEVFQVVEWWNGLELTRELKAARDQPLKWHMWSMSVLLDPSMSWQRILLTKPISLVYIVDDIFDLYGTLDQLILFTQTIKRWEIFDPEGLPNYMKMCFHAIQETTQEISHIVYQKHGFNPFDTLKRSWEKLFDAFLIEAKWFASGHLANADEYLINGIVSSGVPMVLCHLFFIIGDDIMNTEAQWMLNDNHNCISYLVGMILRLYDDLGNAEDEQQVGHDGSYLKCYMKEFEIPSHGVAKRHVMNMVSNTWKKLNECSLSSSSNPFPRSFTKACLNVARMVPIIYDKGQKHDLIALKQCFKSIL